MIEKIMFKFKNGKTLELTWDEFLELAGAAGQMQRNPPFYVPPDSPLNPPWVITQYGSDTSGTTKGIVCQPSI